MNEVFHSREEERLERKKVREMNKYRLRGIVLSTFITDE